MKRVLFALSLGFPAATPLLAQDLPSLPPITEPKPFRLPATETYSLANGLRVTLIPYGVAPKTVVSLRIRAGNAMDRVNTWLGDLTGAMMKEGAGTREAGQLSTAAASMGGSLDVGVGQQSTVVGTNVLAEHVADAIALVGNVALHPTFPAGELGRVKANLGRQLAVGLSEPGTLADIALARAVYGPTHPYGQIVPTAEQLRGYTIDQVRGFHREQFGARRAHLYIAGRFDAAVVKAAIAKAFAGWTPGPEPLRIDAPHQPGGKVILIDRPGAPQTTVRLAFGAAPARSSANIPQRVTNSLLGGAFSSRITTNIRESKGYTYSPQSTIGFHPGEALWTFDADVTTAVTGAALSEVFKEIRRMQTERVPEEEAKGIRTYIAGTFAIQNSTSPAVVSTLASRDLLGLPADWTERYVPAVLAVTTEQMMHSAKVSYPLGTMTLVVVGDIKAVEPQVRALPELKGLAFQKVALP